MTYQHDANGSVTSDGINTYGYDAAGRLRAAATGSYRYNGLGQRIQKVITPVAAGLPAPSLSTTTLFVYDEAGHLIGEYDGSGNLIQETVWLDDLPLAVLKPEGNYYIHADHLGTPRQIDNQQQQAVWVWDTITFGDSIPNENPSGVGVPFKYSLRHPGQYYDAETGLFQNYFRDYNPNLGRYTESDPIGLLGGMNTYAYVGGNPLTRIDPPGQLWWFVFAIGGGGTATGGAAAGGLGFWGAGALLTGGLVISTIPGDTPNSQNQESVRIGPWPGSTTRQDPTEAGQDAADEITLEEGACDLNDREACKRLARKCTQKCTDKAIAGYGGDAKDWLGKCTQSCTSKLGCGNYFR